VKRLAVILGISVVLLFLAGHAIFGRTGFVTLYRLSSESRQLEAQVEHERMRRDSLKIVKQRLQNDPVYIERAAREELGYCYPDETVLKIIPAEPKE